MYFLRSERIGFRCWSVEDLDLAQRLWGDPEVTRLIGGPFTDEEVTTRLHREIETEREARVQYWPIFLLTNDQHLGCCGLRPYGDRPAGEVLELGFHLRRDAWGFGYAQEAARAVIAHAFDTLRVGSLFAGHNPNNVASKRLLEKLGFHYTHDELYAATGLMHPSYQLVANAGDS